MLNLQHPPTQKAHKAWKNHEQQTFLLLWKKVLYLHWLLPDVRHRKGYILGKSETWWCQRTPFACRNDDVMAELDLMKDLNEGSSWSHGKCDGSHGSWHKFASWVGVQSTSYLKQKHPKAQLQFPAGVLLQSCLELSTSPEAQEGW